MKAFSTLVQKPLSFLAILVLYISIIGCSSPRLSQSNSSASGPSAVADQDLLVTIPILEEQLAQHPTNSDPLWASSDTDQMAAAAATHTSTQIKPLISEMEAKAKAKQVISQVNKEAKAQKGLKNKLMAASAKTMVKKLTKKAEKLQNKKDNKGEKQAAVAKEVNNRAYLIIGLVLAIAGLALVIFGGSGWILAVGALAALGGLIFLLLALL